MSSLPTPRQRLDETVTAAGYNRVRFMRQTHSSCVLPRTVSEDQSSLAAEFDGHYSDGQALSLGVLTADCLPILIAGTNHQGQPLVAAIHAGRVGLLAGIIQQALHVLQPKLAAPGSHHYVRPTAVIGPAICGQCYEVPLAMREEAETQFSTIGAETSWGTPALDLSAAAAEVLQQAGIHTMSTGICTREDPAFYSYRGGDITERNAGVVLTPATANKE
ncbi:polyphenol oxidase family protein [Micrococcoides hystricis]|uniref:Polyphenol oxidase family protein n=1 Tax=Micrococcoides hystricis TaxID=1572761 RepID=A0ABV6P902_9MICC